MFFKDCVKTGKQKRLCVTCKRYFWWLKFVIMSKIIAEKPNIVVHKLTWVHLKLKQPHPSFWIVVMLGNNAEDTKSYVTKQKWSQFVLSAISNSLNSLSFEGLETNTWT